MNLYNRNEKEECVFAWYIHAVVMLHVPDIDECALGTHNCGPDFICTNTAGSFRCHPKERCAEGYIQDAAGSCIGEFGDTLK